MSATWRKVSRAFCKSRTPKSDLQGRGKEPTTSSSVLRLNCCSIWVPGRGQSRVRMQGVGMRLIRDMFDSEDNEGH